MHLGIIKITCNRAATHFMDDSFMNLVEEVIPTLLWQSGASELATVRIFCYYFKYLQLTVQMWSFVHCVCVLARVCVCVCVRERNGHITTAACVQTHRSFITVSVTRLCSPLRLELTFILKAKTRDYGKGRYISDSCLWCSANHNALGQLANQRNRLCLSEGGSL